MDQATTGYSLPAHQIVPRTAFEVALLAALAEVMDPELDTSIVDLGFIERLDGDEVSGSVEMVLKLPTFWCSANFAYLMLWDARESLLRVPGVREVRLLLAEHFADDEINGGINRGLSFKEIFPEDATDDLDSLRRTFVEKAYMRRHEILLELLGHHLSSEAIAELKLAAIHENEEGVFLGATRLSGAAGLWKHYLERREKLGFATAENALFCLDAQGQPLSAEAIADYLKKCRTTRLNMDFNRSLCEGLLQARREIEMEVGKT